MFSDVFEIARAWRDADDVARAAREARPRGDMVTGIMQVPAEAAPPLCPADATGAPGGAPCSTPGLDPARPAGRSDRRPVLATLS